MAGVPVDPNAQPGSNLYQKPADWRYPQSSAIVLSEDEEFVNITGGVDEEICVRVKSTCTNGGKTYKRNCIEIDQNILTVTGSTPADCCAKQFTPEFYAATPDPATFQQLGVRTGTGVLTTSHTSTLYAADSP